MSVFTVYIVEDSDGNATAPFRTLGAAQFIAKMRKAIAAAHHRTNYTATIHPITLTEELYNEYYQHWQPHRNRVPRQGRPLA